MFRPLAFFAPLVGLALRAGAGEASPAQVEFFESKIRPVLAEQCYSCHSAQAKKLKAGLLLDDPAALLKGGDSGAAVVPGDPEKSLLNQAIGYHDSSLAMPPKAKMGDRVIADFEQWVKMGVPWPKEEAPVEAPKKEWNWPALQQSHWAFQPMQQPAPPAVKDEAWPRSELDRFVLVKLDAAGLTPAPAADRRTLLRRASYDLIGLPPTPEEAEAFVNDPDPNAFATVVERLLASPQYGERWARHWLDVARYSDGLGGFLDGAALKRDAWRYRDWVVDALNRDLPFDQFVKAQLAGDLLDGGADAVATGFLALGPTYQSDGGTIEGKAVAESETLDDRVDTVARGLLGLTAACARCHDHKFDPIPQQDYYSLAGVFRNTRNDDKPLPGTPKEVIDQYNASVKAIADLQKKVSAAKKPDKTPPTDEEKALLEAQKAELETLKKNAPEQYPTTHVVAEAGSSDMAVALRGNLLKPGEMAPRRFLHIVAGATPALFTRGSGRVELAEAIVQPENPLTARVMVNRVWMRHFGQALVRTPDNFGKVGEKPTHPELLDWLARRFIASGWSLKQLHRTIMLSSAYQMSSRLDQRSFAQDGDNRLLWRMEPRRLDVEAWRDGLLAATQDLDRTMGGPPTQSLLESPRRTLYSIVSRNGDKFQSDDFLRLFDFPSARATSAERHTSIVPQQFLFMMNSPFMAKRAESLAKRLQADAPDAAGRIARAYRLLFDREPTADEARLGSGFLQSASLAEYAQVLLSSNEFLFLR
ncbi:MAG TPA: PSD1 and planctomycete cytochrome C domain-containing protein [Chthoniobacteraceae bacterium]|jgi:cytochrome c553|nr:PSD1 and planctomycete cytochrome C domain-containing protein [Chthoniobacteraceae bacterium]